MGRRLTPSHMRNTRGTLTSRAQVQLMWWSLPCKSMAPPVSKTTHPSMTEVRTLVGLPYILEPGHLNSRQHTNVRKAVARFRRGDIVSRHVTLLLASMVLPPTTPPRAERPLSLRASSTRRLAHGLEMFVSNTLKRAPGIFRLVG